MTNNLISIIIPTYNRRSLLPETLDSIAKQTYTNFECLVIDDRSTDETKDYLITYSQKDPRFKYFLRFEDKPKGANVCRNIGLDMAKGDYIVFFDSDDVMTPDHLEVKIHGLQSNRCDFVITKTKYFNFDDGNLSLDVNYTFKTKDISLYNYVSQTINWLTLDIAIVSHIAKQCRFNELLSSGQEYNYFSKILTKTTNGVILDNIVSLRRYHQESIQSKLRKDKNKMTLSYFIVYWNTYRDIKKQATYDVRKNLVYKCYRSFKKYDTALELTYIKPLTWALIKIFGIKGLYYALDVFVNNLRRSAYAS
ncbi:glycosyltransferase family 2 protein [Winogradskyella sp. A3E31]|uniref:glycosyltransferase family 2 protein n=1 Tax=Winogradskyella sp. A3E31 TaxID=3349637 RepID=UPI00398B6D0C